MTLPNFFWTWLKAKFCCFFLLPLYFESCNLILHFLQLVKSKSSSLDGLCTLNLDFKCLYKTINVGAMEKKAKIKAHFEGLTKS